MPYDKDLRDVIKVAKKIARSPADATEQIKKNQAAKVAAQLPESVELVSESVQTEETD
jgi:hypothetical protein